jgi:hypothetical protein
MTDDAGNQKESKKTKRVGRGGPRARSGRPKGKVNAKTLEIQAAAKLYAGDALQALVDVAQNSSSDGARVAAASALLDRGYGRPRQAIEHSGNVVTPGVLMIPAAPDATAWARAVAERQASLVALVPPPAEDAA